MALTQLQRDVCRLLAAKRRERGESYVAGGVALSVALQTQRLSRDLDIFHDTSEAVARAWDADRATLEAHGYTVNTLRAQPGYVEAEVARAGGRLLAEWARDSAFRFFPLIEHDELGLTLHPFDLATNKVLALVGRLEVRDWIDVIACNERVQPLGYLAWSACGKDPGFTPQAILDEARRSSRYSDDEVSALAFEGPPPRAAELSRQWRAILAAAADVVKRLPADHAGHAVVTRDGRLFTGDAAALGRALDDGQSIAYHPGRLGGALPTITPVP